MKTVKNISLFTFLLAIFCNVSLHAQKPASDQAPASKTSTVKITTTAECEMCKTRIEKEVSLIKGVKKAELNLETKVLTVEYNAKKVTPDKIRKAISNLGYDADDVKANNKATQGLPHCCQPKIDSVPH